jgi:DeoR/GlpR family transcriptional regulator of sugar metabolism
MATRAVLSNTERQQQLLRFIEQRGRVSIASICDQFAVSMATARRDLEALAERGAVKRVHGGALAVQKAPPEPPVMHRASEQAEAKRRIAEAAAAMIGDGETVFLSPGTTVLELARCLRDRTNLTVISNSLLVIDELLGATGVTLIALGGMLRRSEMSMIGHLAELAIAELRADKVVLGIRAIDVEQGLTSDYVPEMQTDRAILRSGREVIVVADHTKFGRSAAVFLGPLTSIHTLVTDAGTAHKYIDAIRARGIKVVVV